MKRIPYGRQHLDTDDIKAVVQILHSDFLTQGPTIERFEQAIADYFGCRYAVTFSSGTAALHGACFAAEIGPGSEVITTPMSFAASANCVLYCGATPVFADIKTNVPIIDPLEIEKKITKKTRAIIPVDYSGLPADYAEINKLAKKHRLLTIADSVHSLGATYKGKKVGTLADMTVFSFHPVKLITTGEGGMAVTSNKTYYDRLILFRNHGITKNQKNLINKHVGEWYYEMQELGYNYRLTDIQAALGLSQLKKITKFLKRRQEIASIYQEAFRNSTAFSYLKLPSDRTSAWHLFPIQLNKKFVAQRKEIVEEFHKRGIRVQVHYIPTHLHPFYRNKFGFKRGDFPVSENYYDREISLPLFPRLTPGEINRVIRVTKQIIT